MIFWRSCPALSYGLFILVGITWTLTNSWVCLLPLVFLCLDCSLHTVIGFLIGIASAVYTSTLYDFPKEEGPIEGTFYPSSLSIIASPFQKTYLYQGTMGKVPCQIFLPIHKPRPMANQAFHVTGLLTKAETPFPSHPNYVVKKALITPISRTWSFTEQRFAFKERLNRYLEHRFPDKTVASFLASMITGSVDDRMMSLQFQKLGLQHLLGVSGFQFILLAACLGRIFSCFFSYRTCAVLVFGCLTLYFIILGDSPPVMRAYIAISIYLAGILLNRLSLPLNTLGWALIIELLWNPLSIFNIGFQLTFLSTFAILTLYPIFRLWMSAWVPLRSFQEARQLKLWDLHGYLLGHMIRDSIALNTAVHLVTLPVLLALFQRFSLMSFIYNLFFPFGAAITYLLALVGSLIPFIDRFTEWMAASLLNLAANPPSIADFVIQTKAISFEMAAIALTVLLTQLAPYSPLSAIARRGRFEAREEAKVVSTWR